MQLLETKRQRGSGTLPGEVSFSPGSTAPRSGTDGRVRASGPFLWKDQRKFFVQGVTYGPFAPNAQGEFFACRETTRADFARIAGELHANTIRTYYAPPNWLLDEAMRANLHVLVDIPWPKHLCFLESQDAQRQARAAVRAAVQAGGGRASVLAYSIGNEIPADVVRWYGAPRVERFLRELADVARQEDDQVLLTYANFPSTEFLQTSDFLDFQMFNVYLQDEAAFRRYLLRLQNLAKETPLVLGEFGLDTFRNGEQAQAEILRWHLRAVRETGLAGTTVYAWTDDWYTGGHQIEDWAFGITRRDRSPKSAFEVVRQGFTQTTSDLLGENPPKISVIVCSYNGGRTLTQCLESLRHLDYLDYEVILVDDGSTDDTRAIVARFPEVRAIHQTNHGLSHARNVGLEAATGEIVAYTDSDCFADPDWLTLLALRLRETNRAGVGGPNLTPDDGPLASWVSVAPGQPTHVLVSDTVAEHIPGCNMAFRRETLQKIGGFDPRYRVAGDDVDLCWRLQEAGEEITFAPSAFVWHHRRQNLQTYLKQQRGYGNAEGILRFHHPDRFNDRGDSRWRGLMYGASLGGLRTGGPLIHHGVFGAGLFQTVYARQPAHLLMLPGALEWVAVAGGLLLLAPFFPALGMVSGVMLLTTILIAAAQAAQAHLPARYDSGRGRCVVFLLTLTQPLVRSWARYYRRFQGKRHAGRRMATVDSPAAPGVDPANPLLLWQRERAYWGEEWQERSHLLTEIVAALSKSGAELIADNGWTRRDADIFLGMWAKLRLRSVQEDHGGGCRLIRLRFRLIPSQFTQMAVPLLLVLLALLAAGLHSSVHASAGLWFAVGSAVSGTVAVGIAWLRVARRARVVLQRSDQVAQSLGFWRVRSRVRLRMHSGTQRRMEDADSDSDVRYAAAVAAVSARPATTAATAARETDTASVS